MVENLRLSAHRGAHTVAPENTVEAYRAAINMGYGAIEIDPCTSSDGEVFIMHDATVDRTTNGTGNIATMSSSQVKELEIDVSSYPKYENQILRVPTLEDAVKVIATSNLILNIDGSKADWSDTTFTKKIVDTLRRYNLFERTYFVISNKAQRDAFNSAYPTATISWLQTDANGIESAISSAKSYQRAMLSIPLSIATDKLLTTLRNTNVYYQIYNVNNQSDLDRLTIKKVPMMETDMLVP